MSAISVKYEKWFLPSIVMLTLLVFSPVVGFDFVNFDDPYFVYQNPYVQGGMTFEAVRWAFTPGFDGNWIPLTWLSHILDVQLFGMNPGAHHAVNVFFHAASSGLLFHFLHRSTGAVWRSAIVALLFALHPLHVESVAWIAERKDVLSTFFFMLTICAYQRYSTGRSAAGYVTVLMLFTLGLLSKSMLVTVPFVLLLLDYWPLKSLDLEANNGVTPTKLLVEKVPLVLLSMTSGLVTYFAHAANQGVSGQYSLMVKLARSLVAYLTYISKTFWPAKLAVFYPFISYPPAVLEAVAVAIIFIMITFLAFKMRRSAPYLLTGWLWFVVTLLPVSGLVQIGKHSWADRYSYIPLIGLFVIIVWSATKALATVTCCKQIIYMLIPIFFVALITSTSIQLQHWRNSATLFRHALAVTDNNWLAHYNLGLALYKADKLDEAAQQFAATIKISPSYTDAYINLGLVHRSRKDYANAEEVFRRLLLFGSARNEARLELGVLYLEMGKRALAMEQYTLLQNASSPLAVSLMREIVAIDAARSSVR